MNLCLKLVGLAALAFCVGAGGCSGGSYVKSVQEDHGTYYRLKVKLTYKGEPQDFDIVVGCNVRQITYKDNSTTYEAGIVPVLFGRRMSDGKGLVVRPPNACEGETTANGKVQPDLLPVVVVYDNADTLAFGKAYLSEDAYQSPASTLKFGGAIIESATRADFDRFRRAQPNLVRRESLFKAEGGDLLLRRMNLPDVAEPLGFVCEGYERYRIPPELRSLARQYWPKSHPRYWQFNSADNERDVVDTILPRSEGTPIKYFVQSDSPNDTPRSPLMFRFISEWQADYGMPTKTGGGLILRTRGLRFPPAYYPATTDYRRDLWPQNPIEWSAYIESHDKFYDSIIDYQNGRMRGFAYCFSRVFPKIDELFGKRALGRVDGAEISSEYQQSRTASPGSNVPVWIFERDEYLFYHFEIPLGSVRGDV